MRCMLKKLQMRLIFLEKNIMNLVKPVFKCAESFKEIFKKTQCLLTISVGQEVHEREKFEATIALVNSAFDSCIMLIDDSLQRHTMALDTAKDADFFYELSIKEGDDWLKRNEKYYSKLSILKKIIRWNVWLQHPLYLECGDNIRKLIQNDSNYKDTFDSTINEFLRRYYQRKVNNEPANPEQDYSLCLNYLIEECTAMCLWPELNCQFEVYPSQRNLAMAETHKRFVLGKHPDLLHAVAIKFKNRKQLKPQIFENLVTAVI